MTEITDAEAAEIQWASSEQGKAAVRAGYDKARQLGWTTDMADAGAIVFAAARAGGWASPEDAVTEARWRWAISHKQTTQPPESQPVTIAAVETDGSIVTIDILRHTAPDETGLSAPAEYIADVVEVHQAGWEPVLLQLPHCVMRWRLGTAIPGRDEALARAEQEAVSRNRQSNEGGSR